MMTLNRTTFERFNLVSELIPYVADKYRNKTAVSYYFDKKTVSDKSYIDLYKDVKKFAYYLKERKLEGKTICLIGDCSYEWIVSFYSIIWMGAYPVLIDNRLSSESTMNLIRLADSKSVIFENKKNSGQLIDLMKKEDISFIGLNSKSNKSYVEACVNDLVENSKNEMEHFASANQDDLALIVYTSGTTGNNKAVMLSHRNLCAGLALAYYVAGREKHTGTVAALPVHHMLELTTGIQTPLFVGVPICIGRGKKYFVQSISKFKPSTLILVPSVIEMIRKKIWADARLNNKEKQLILSMKISNLLRKMGLDFRSKIFSQIHLVLGGNLKTIISGGAPISNEIVEEFRSWGIEIYNGYGITECSPVVSCNMREHHKDGSVGITGLAPLCEVQIIEDEVCVRGDIVMMGYYNDDKATEEAFKDGYFRTGDIGYIDKDGYLFITGRKKNLIILSNGENVSPEELETMFSNIEGVKDILVCSKKVGSETILGAIVVPSEEYKNRENLQEYFSEQFTDVSSKLPPQKRIYEVNIRDKDFIMSS
ncbi:MAG: AMP-binding protein, partial [Lachnospiraceae bacterium]|nr:AMP-binding protein [Lachnospiraceae bacterium]